MSTSDGSKALAKALPRVDKPTQFGETVSEAGFWVEYPDGLVDLTRTKPLAPDAALPVAVAVADADAHPPPLDPATQLELPVDGARTLRLVGARTALVVVDMQNFFLHQGLREHPTGLACVDPLLAAVPALRAKGVKIVWLQVLLPLSPLPRSDLSPFCHRNWGLTPQELHTLPPSLARQFTRPPRGGFGSPLPEPFGPLLMRGSYNAQLYGPLHDLFLAGDEAGTDVWVNKNRISGLWGYQSALDLYLKENGVRSLLFAGVNADQCVMGTYCDAYYRGYDVVMVRDAVATTSPAGGLENVIYNAGVRFLM
jgi:nicotinamidase-related amidase